jgi:hypothetical protein
MSNLSVQHIGKYTYIYESKSFRDSFGRPRNKKTRIGKLDLVTSELIYTEEYIKSHPELQKLNPTNIDNGYKIRDIIFKTLENVLDYGLFWFFQNLAEMTGLLNILQESFPFIWQEIFTLACYMVTSDKPFMYCDDWIAENYWLDAGGMSSQRISDLLSKFGDAERAGFYKRWCKHITERECLALDITSISSYSKNIEECEWGHNRDKEKLPQVNLCMLFGEKSRLPVYQTSYCGSLGDVTTLEATLMEFKAMVGKKEISLVMDKGFYSKKNVNTLLKNNVKFIVSVPFTNYFACEIVTNESDTIDSLSNVILTSDYPVRGVERLLSWDKGPEYLHIFAFFDPVKALKNRNALYLKITTLKSIAEIDPYNKDYRESIEQYFIMKKSNKLKSGYSVKLREDILATELKHTGWFILISNHIKNAQKAFDIYRLKDVVEKGFWKYKNSLGLERLRVHSDIRAHNKEFIAFIALILSSFVHKTMKDNDLYQSMTFDKLFLTLAKIKSSQVNGIQYIGPLTKQQKEIFKVFGIPLPCKIFKL